MRKKISKNKKNKAGFMMIEAAFSIFIVGTILVTFLAVLGSVYRTEFAKRDIVIASNLAQEGIEIVRNIRDNNWKAATPKNAFDFPFPSGNYCVDYLGLNGICTNQLNINSDGFYGYAAGITSKFSRTINISGSGDSRTITSMVTWNGKNSTMTDVIYAWGDVD